MLLLTDHSKWRENKNKTWGGIMLIRTYVLKVINNERQILNDHVIIDCIAEQIESMITQVCKESKLWILPNLRRPSFSFTYSFNFTYLRISSFHCTHVITSRKFLKWNLTLNKRWYWSSCAKLAVSASWTHGLIAQSVRAS